MRIERVDDDRQADQARETGSPRARHARGRRVQREARQRHEQVRGQVDDHSARNAPIEKSRSMRNSAISATDEATMNTGIRNTREPDQREATRRPAARRCPRRSQMCRKRSVTCTLPRAQRSRCFHSPAMSRGSSAQHDGVRLEHDAPAAELDVQRRERVLGQRGGVDRPPIASRLSGGCSCAPPARQACAPRTFCARRARRPAR